MTLFHRFKKGTFSQRALSAALALAIPMLVSGCKKMLETHDPQLKPIQEMLEANVPAGTPESVVNQFLSTRGYPTEMEHKPGTIVAIIRHIDTEKLQPVTARVTFYFDANGKLNATEVVRTPNQPIPQ